MSSLIIYPLAPLSHDVPPKELRFAIFLCVSSCVILRYIKNYVKITVKIIRFNNYSKKPQHDNRASCFEAVRLQGKFNNYSKKPARLRGGNTKIN